MSSAPASRDLANAIRALSMDAVQKANSGHPGAPMGMADIAEVLWRGFLKHNPQDPTWADRDRFVLSNGHGSMLLYSLLHLSGYGVSIEDIKNFRQLGSPTAGHPEYGDAPGIETTTGPLGQGIANAVGMALAEKMLAGQFNRDGHTIVDHNTYCFLGDGCMMEGISHEACSLAGTLGLGKLIAFYDDNGISIDGEVEGWFTDDTVERFRAYGWQVIPNVDGHNAEEVKVAIENARANTDQPTLICCKTIIGFGSPNKQGKEESHGAALGDDEIALTRKELGWQHGPFEIPADIKQAWDASDTGAAAQGEWQQRFEAYKAAYPELAAEFLRRQAGELPADFAEQADAYIRECQEKGEKVATRKASQNALDAFGPLLPELAGGSADLAGSNNTLWKGCKPVSAEDASGNYIHYGVREFGMTAVQNGLCLHGGLRPYGGTFLVFMEYARNAVRMAALMHQPNILVYTHDSIGLGEDGPTHQPIEQIANLRLTPNMRTWRPCDTVESAVSWKKAILRQDGPSSLIFSRQGLPCMARGSEQLAAIEKGGYTLLQTGEGTPDAIIIATGSEVELAVKAAEALAGKNIRVVSMPCVEEFLAQDAAYQESVLPSSVRARVAVEAAIADYWYRFVGLDGKVVGMTSFGASAPAGDLFKHFGITAEAVQGAVESLL
ncbi:MAG: transketolase [Alcanivoracaceae bacterium]|uniref:Transketolase n=1 Tax=Alcanivorax profundi TaxID=2338368 RepID=A0A418Y0C6_9GAMM|nr:MULTISPECIES: transketolase [Alcanivorax]MAX55800.1 transketolase [Alcanivoracaceae bacterium]MCG8436557.1 transketolase [Pseudomonadales bacterium]MEE2870885.1 transketolase [Pseudomonadota bacterium]ERP90072.1 transketolase [Alcanivorax sp. P2S70]PNE02331.1 transketolase [Alcanivorax sp. MD8A]